MSGMISLSSDHYKILFTFLDVTSVYNFSLTCKFATQIIESEELKALWQETATKMGCKECFTNRTWKQTCCILVNRWANPEYEMNIVDAGLKPHLEESSVRLKGSYSESLKTYTKDEEFPIIEIIEGKVIWQDAESSRELLSIEQLPGFSLDACALHGSLLAMTFYNDTLSHSYFAKDIKTILRVWNLDTKKQVFERQLYNEAATLQISATDIVLFLCTSGGDAYEVFSLCIHPPSNKSFLGQITELLPCTIT